MTRVRRWAEQFAAEAPTPEEARLIRRLYGELRPANVRIVKGA